MYPRTAWCFDTQMVPGWFHPPPLLDARLTPKPEKPPFRANPAHPLQIRRKLAPIHRKLGSSGGSNVEDWKFTQQDASEALAKLHFFSIKKKHAHGEVEARITVKEFATAKTTDMKFFAVADIELNQKSMKFQPCGWAETLMGALTECLRNLRKFEYESPELPAATSEDGAQL
jgi:hypothetical protein